MDPNDPKYTDILKNEGAGYFGDDGTDKSEPTSGGGGGFFGVLVEGATSDEGQAVAEGVFDALSTDWVWTEDIPANRPATSNWSGGIDEFSVESWVEKARRGKGIVPSAERLAAFYALPAIAGDRTWESVWDTEIRAYATYAGEGANAPVSVWEARPARVAASFWDLVSLYSPRSIPSGGSTSTSTSSSSTGSSSTGSGWPGLYPTRGSLSPLDALSRPPRAGSPLPSRPSTEPQGLPVGPLVGVALAAAAFLLFRKL